VLDGSQRVAVYWQLNADEVTVVSYHDTVSAANTAARAAEAANGARPTVAINWFHSTITHVQVGPIPHPDARVALPTWIDAEPNA
jgi:hypothetical protein